MFAPWPSQNPLLITGLRLLENHSFITLNTHTKKERKTIILFIIVPRAERKKETNVNHQYYIKLI